MIAAIFKMTRWFAKDYEDLKEAWTGTGQFRHILTWPIYSNLAPRLSE